MSSSNRRMPLAQALACADRLRSLLSDSYHASVQPRYVRWVIAGSCRRRTADVGDIEHVVMPSICSEPVPGMLFGEQRVELVSQRLDELHAAGTISRQIKSDGRQRWGPRYKALVFEGLGHELFFARPDNWGAILAIRTGSADYSHGLVTMLGDRGYAMRDGAVYRRGDSIDPNADDTLIPVRTEQHFFDLCGVDCVEPAQREGWPKQRRPA